MDKEITKEIKVSIQPIKEGLLKFEELTVLMDKILNYLGNETEKNSLWKLRYRKFHEEVYGKRINVDSNDYVSTHDSFGALGGWSVTGPIIDFYFNYINQKKIIKRLVDEDLWVESRTEGNESHIFVGKRSDKKDKVHLIFGETGEIRIDKKDLHPGEILNKVESVLMTKDGRVIRSTFEFEDE